MKKINILLVEDEALIREGLRSLLEKEEFVSNIFEAANAKEFRYEIDNHPIDIVLLDISMPVMDGFATARWLKENHPAVKVMALTMQGDDESLIKMIKAGATGYLNKNVHPAELEKALTALSQKGLYYPDWAASRVLYALSHDTENNQLGIKLSERETEFLKYSCTELTYKEIGLQMFCSPRTVESYRDALFGKLSVKTRVALALYAVKIGLHKL